MGFDDIIQDGNRFLYALKVPKDRIAVFIGEKGVTKRKLADTLAVKLEIDSPECEVTVTSPDSLALMVAKDVVKAIARGFNPDVALQLTKQDFVLELLDISEFASSKDAIIRLRGRVIGMNGKSRSAIEEMTECDVVVYGKTVAIIGETERASIAKRAVEALLSGSQHAAVYKWLEKQRRKLHEQEMHG